MPLRILIALVLLGIPLARAAHAVPAAPSAHGASASAFFAGLGDLPGGAFESAANGVSGDGSTVVGQSRSSFASQSIEAFVWTEAGEIVGLGDFGPGAPKSRAFAASWDGSVIVGDADTAAAPSNRAAFRWTASTGLVPLVDSVGAIQGGTAHDVSADGSVIVGVRSNFDVGANEAFRWTAAQGVVGLGWLPSSLNDSFAFDVSADGDVGCGISNSMPAGAVEPFRWALADGMVGLGDVPGGIFYAIAWGVSGDGATVVGSARANGSNDEMFIWREEAGFVLPDSTHGATFSSSAFAASADGAVVVGYSEPGAVIWDASSGTRELRAILADDLGLDLSGWQLGAATGVSDDGRTIVGLGINPAGDREGWIARLPESQVAVDPARPREGLIVELQGPNPFRDETRFTVAAPVLAAGVRAEVVSAEGRRVRTLLDARGESFAVLRWDGRDDRGREAAAGVYYLLVDAPPSRASHKIVLVR